MTGPIHPLARLLGAADDDFTELVDADFKRVDLVGKPANGVGKFLIAKSGGNSNRGLVGAEVVKDVLKAAENRGLVMKAEVSDLTDEKLRRMAVDGSVAERRAAHEEIGKRTLAGLSAPRESDPATKKPNMGRTPPTDLNPAPDASVGTPAAEAAIAKARAQAAAIAKARAGAAQRFAESVAKATQAALDQPDNPGAVAFAALQTMLAKGQGDQAAQRASEVARSTSDQQPNNSLPKVPVDTQTYTNSASPDASATRGPVGPEPGGYNGIGW